MINRFPGGMTAPQQWLDLLRPKLPNVPPDMIKHEVLSVVRDYCKLGGAWRDWLHPVEIDGLALEYGLPTGNPDTEVVAVLEIWPKGAVAPLVAIPPEIAGPPSKIRRGGAPVCYWQTQPDRVFFDPIPSAGSVLVDVYVTLAPTDLCGIPEWFLSDNQLAIVDGVLASICRLPGPNYRPTDADVHRRAYVAQRNRSRTRAIGGYNRSDGRLRAPFFARGSQR
jgi:hypothetical protein